MTVMKHNMNDISGMVKLCKNLNIGNLNLRRFVPCGSGLQFKDKILQPMELKRIYRLINSITTNPELMISTGCENALWILEDTDFITHGCSTAYDSLTILPNGDVFPCRRLPINVGNVTEQTLYDIWYSSDVLWNLVKIRDASPTDPPILDADDYGYQSLRRDIVNIYGGGWGDGGGGGFTMLRLYFSGSLDTCDN